MTTEELELKRCTFTPDINQKSAEIDQSRNKSTKGVNRLFELADKSQKKIEKLRVSDYIKKEIEFRNRCSFTPKTLDRSLSNR